MPYLARDFVETGEGLFFAVVANSTEEKRLLAFLRYVREGESLRKVATAEANHLIGNLHPGYLFYSSLRDVDLHGIPLSKIHRHHQPRVRAAALSESEAPDPVERKAGRVIARFGDAGIPLSRFGVTGSLLLDAHTERSDIDIVVYDREAFFKVRETIREATEGGDFDPLDADLWEDAFDRRAPSLSLEEYIWHERRKHNKLVIDGTKVDVSLVTTGTSRKVVRWRKVEKMEIRAEVTDDRETFDYPARFTIRHPEIPEIVSYTNTFTGQARRGETILACGWRERSEHGDLRLLVGTSREADGEFIKVVPA